MIVMATTNWYGIEPKDFVSECLKQEHGDYSEFLYGAWHDLPQDKFLAGDLVVRFKPTGEHVYCRVVEVYRFNGVTRCRITPINLDLMFTEINPAFMYSVNEDDLYLFKRVNSGIQ